MGCHLVKNGFGFMVSVKSVVISYVDNLEPLIKISKTSLKVLKINAHLALFVWKDDTITAAQTHW